MRSILLGEGGSLGERSSVGGGGGRLSVLVKLIEPAACILPSHTAAQTESLKSLGLLSLYASVRYLLSPSLD